MRDPTPNQIKIQFLIKRYRYKHKDEPEKIKQLEHILWYSYPIVYPHYEQQTKEAEYLINSRKSAKYRTYKFLNYMADCYDQLYFVTLTFTDDVLESTNERTRHRYVSKYLKEQVRCYYANIDYGDKNKREHYHAVVSDKIDFNDWRFGNADARKVANTKGDRQRIGTYMRKLTNHANKFTTGKAFHTRGRIEVDELPY